MCICSLCTLMLSSTTAERQLQGEASLYLLLSGRRCWTTFRLSKDLNPKVWTRLLGFPMKKWLRLSITNTSFVSGVLYVPTDMFSQGPALCVPVKYVVGLHTRLGPSRGLCVALLKFWNLNRLKQENNLAVKGRYWWAQKHHQELTEH